MGGWVGLLLGCSVVSYFCSIVAVAVALNDNNNHSNKSIEHNFWPCLPDLAVNVLLVGGGESACSSLSLIHI